MPVTPIVIPSITGGVTELFADEPITYAVKSSVTVRGGRLVELTADFEVQEAGADSAKVVGIALYDGNGANGDKIAVAWEGVWYCLVADAGGIAVGDRVQTAAAGTVQNGGTAINTVGKALAAAADAALVPVMLHIGG